MEQSILENSKGATYMSFVLDIEIVIKTNSEQVNLAENMAKSQVSKKKNEDTSEPYGSSRKENTNVYVMSSKQTPNIFTLSLNNQEDRKYNDSEATVREILNEIIDLCTNSYPEKVVLSRSLRNMLRKKKISKEDKTSKVFKGKIEAVDFLECNRIFMCNYLKIPMHYFKNSTKSSKTKSNKTLWKKISRDETELTQVDKHKAVDTRRKRFKLWKPSISKINDFSKIKEKMEDKYSSGDQILCHDQESNIIRVHKLSNTNLENSVAKINLSKLANTSLLKFHANFTKKMCSISEKNLTFSYSFKNILQKSTSMENITTKSKSFPSLSNYREDISKFDKTRAIKSNDDLRKDVGLGLSDLGLIFCNGIDKQVVSDMITVDGGSKVGNKNYRVEGKSGTVLVEQKYEVNQYPELDCTNKNNSKLNGSDNSQHVKNNLQKFESDFQCSKNPRSKICFWRKFPKCKFPKLLKVY